MLDRITANLQFHGQALALRSERQQVLASNIANADTPNYQARDFDFAQALRRASGTFAHAPGVSTTSATNASATGAGPATTSLALAAAGGGAMREAFLPLAGTRPGGGPVLAWRTPEQPSLDGNTVDLDRERANFADNSLRYEATLRFINGNVRNVLSAIRGD